MLTAARKCWMIACHKLNIEPGQTTTDGKLTVEFAECLGICDFARRARRRRPCVRPLGRGEGGRDAGGVAHREPRLRGRRGPHARRPAYPSPVSWTNQNLVVYHGTIQTYGEILLASVNVFAGKARTDFGTGFLTTTLPQARSWAHRLAFGTGQNPVVVESAVPRDGLASLDCVWFVRGDADADDFWSLVKHCRTGRRMTLELVLPGMMLRSGRSPRHGGNELVTRIVIRLVFIPTQSQTILNASNRVFVP